MRHGVASRGGDAVRGVAAWRCDAIYCAVYVALLHVAALGRQNTISCFFKRVLTVRSGGEKV